MARKSKARTSEKGSRSRTTKGTGSRRASRAEGSDRSDYRRKTRAGKLAQGKKGSCAPKLFMLIVPFAVLLTYVVLTTT